MDVSSHVTKRAKRELPETSVRDILTLRFIKSVSETQFQRTPIQPKFCHHIFGEDEVVFGYEGLRLTLWIDLESFHCFLEIQFDSKSPEADDLRLKFKQFFEYEFLESMLDLQKQRKLTQPLKESELGQFSTPKIPFHEGQLLIHWNQLSTAPEALKLLHYRLEPFLGFFIDGFQCIDTSDPNWTIFFAILQTPTSIQLIGYTTVYRFFAYPSSWRFRIGQMFVLPDFQNQGIGKAMFKAIEHFVKQQQNGVDLSIEDPTEAMSHLTRLIYLEEFRKVDWMMDRKRVTSESHSFALTKSEIEWIHSELKIPRKEITLLWFLFLLVESIKDPDTTSRILTHLRKTLAINLSSPHEGKAIFQELGSDGGFKDSFMMIKCRLKTEIQKCENVIISVPVIDHDEEAETKQIIENKIQVILKIVQDLNKP